MVWVRRVAVAAAILAVAIPAGVFGFATGGKHPAAAISPSPSPSPSVSVRFTTAPPAHPVDEPGLAKRLFAMTNSERVKHRLPALKWWPAAVPIAKTQTQRMVKDDRLYHNAGLNSLLVTLHVRVLGENVGVGPNIDAVQRAFMHSREHKDNILTPTYRLAAIWVIRDERNFVWVTVNFGQP